jgi:hypothetical protein
VIDIERELAERTVEVGECLEWIGPYGKGLRTRAVPMIKRRVNGVRIELNTAREVWRHYKGDPPPGHVVFRRECLNDRCVLLGHLACVPRGAHLRARRGTPQARLSQATRAAIAVAARANSCYSVDQVDQVRALLATGCSCVEVSRRTGVKEATVTDIKGGRSWASTAPAGSVWTWRAS